MTIDKLEKLLESVQCARWAFLIALVVYVATVLNEVIDTRVLLYRDVVVALSFCGFIVICSFVENVLIGKIEKEERKIK